MSHDVKTNTMVKKKKKRRDRNKIRRPNKVGKNIKSRQR